MVAIRPNTTASTPGSMSGTKPKTYGPGRRCLCGAKISTYTSGKWCNLCAPSKERQRHYRQNPKEIPVEPEKMTAKQAADYLGVSGKELKQLERDGKIEVVDRGRGLFGSKYLASSVREFKLDEIEAAYDEASRHAEKEAAAMDNGEKLDRALAKCGPVKPAHVHTEDCCEGVGAEAELVCNEAIQEAAERARREQDSGRHEHTPECIKPTGPSSGLLMCSVPAGAEITDAEPGYPDPRDFDANDEGAALYEKAVRDFEGSTKCVPVDEAMQCCGQRPEGEYDCANCPEREQDEVPGAGTADDLLSYAWAIIANGADWNLRAGDPESEWLKAAKMWRDQYHSYLDEGEPEPGDDDVESSDTRDDFIVDEALAVAARAIARLENMDPEVKAMDTVSRALVRLTNEQRFRVVQWAVDRFYIVEASAEGKCD